MALLDHDELAQTVEEDTTSDFQLFLQATSNLTNRSKGVSVVWKNLTVSAEIKKQSLFKRTKKSYKTVIRDVTGAIYPGNLVALMGSSGAGKTTLLSVLASRCPSGFRIEGDIRIDGQPIEKFDKRVSGYVYQDDLFMSSLTVMEHLNFVAKLRLDRSIDAKDRQQLILKILKDIGLQGLADRRISNSKHDKEKTSLSGGERKRLSVATELLTEPMLLFCDEPTTGLDSYTAQKLITMLQNLAINRNKTIICSIHQPNQQIFELFKQIVLLSHGKIIFNGSPNDAKAFFQSQGYHYTEDQNPAEYFIKTIAIKHTKEDQSKDSLHVAFAKSEFSIKVNKYVENVMKQNRSELLKNTQTKKIQPPCWFSKFLTVSHRKFIDMNRNSHARNVRIVQKFLIGILIGLCLHGTITRTQPGLRALQAAVYVMFNQNFYPSYYIALSLITDDLPLFYREYSNNSITPFIFYLSSIITVLPIHIVEPLSYTLVIYFLAGLRTDAYAVIISMIINILLYIVSSALGVLYSVIFDSLIIAHSYGNPTLNVLSFCCGLFIRLSSLPFIMSWVTYISWFEFACAAIYIVQLQDVHDIECDPNPNVPCLHTGSEVLESFDFDKHSLSYYLGMMVLLYFIFHIIAYIRLLFKIKRRTI